MAQRRYLEYGVAVDYKVVNLLHSCFHSSALLYGFDPVVANENTYTLSDGASLNADGLVIIESSTNNIVVPITSAAKEYTLVVYHEDIEVIGGSEAYFTLVDGIVSSYTNGTIIGWIEYPGGSVNIDESMYTKAPVIKHDSLDIPRHDEEEKLIAPFTEMVTTITNSNVVETFEQDSENKLTRLLTAGSGTQIIEFVINRVSREKELKHIDINLHTSTTTSIECEVNDTDGNQVLLSTISGTGVDQTISLDTSAGTYVDNGVLALRLKFTIQNLQSVQLQSIVFSYRTLPF